MLTKMRDFYGLIAQQRNKALLAIDDDADKIIPSLYRRPTTSDNFGYILFTITFQHFFQSLLT